MTYITSMERRGIEKGLEQGILKGLKRGIEQGLEQGTVQGILQGELQNARETVIEVLQIRFGQVPKLLVKTIKLFNDINLLKTLHRNAITIESVDTFENLLSDLLPDD